VVHVFLLVLECRKVYLVLFFYVNDIGFLTLRGSVRLFAVDTANFYPCMEVTELVESLFYH
jgi:hypothetical protein